MKRLVPRADWLIGAFVWLATFILYLRTLAPSVAEMFDDSLEFQLLSVRMSIAHPTGYPLYRLEWQSVGSLERRLRNCLVGIRAESYEFGAPELVDLELYLMWRARGMLMDAPAVRP
jgi:sulfur-oxidizing protein SoxA